MFCQHIFRFINHFGFFFENQFFDIIIDSLITLTYFSNNKIQKNDTGHNDNYDPGNPENHSLKLRQMIRQTKVEIAERKSQDCEYIFHELCHLAVFVAWKLFAVVVSSLLSTPHDLL